MIFLQSTLICILFAAILTTPILQDRRSLNRQTRKGILKNEKTLAQKPCTVTEQRADTGNGKGANSQADKISLRTDLVSIKVAVSDSHGRFVPGLNIGDFEVFDDKVKQQITHFSNVDVPISVGIAYDSSGSMRNRILRSLRSLRRFIQTSHEEDDFFVIAFSDEAKLVQDFTRSADELIASLMNVEPDGRTALYDAVYLSLKKLQHGRHSRKALLIISDGQDNNSRYTYKQLRNYAEEANVQIYAIGITDPETDPMTDFGRSVLTEITRIAEGRAFFPYGTPQSQDQKSVNLRW
jgi:Ca-activated chloride channel family protein